MKQKKSRKKKVHREREKEFFDFESLPPSVQYTVDGHKVFDLRDLRQLRFTLGDGSEEEYFTLGDLWQARWKVILEAMPDLRNSRNDVQDKLLDVLYDKMRVRWLKRMEAEVSLKSMETEGRSVRILIRKGSSGDDMLFHRLKLEPMFCAFFLLSFSVLTFPPLSLLSFFFDVRYMPLALLLLMEAATVMYFLAPPKHRSCGQMLLGCVIPVVSLICRLVSSSGPEWSTVLCLGAFTVVYHAFIHRLTLSIIRILKHVAPLDPFECDYISALRCLP
ncbi:MAG: hypothetical protein LBT65_02325 [Synergistaceae bacterium]|jgi:hypothetical protein|nr:hypothetical protein [Synergistaceae bacterium]